MTSTACLNRSKGFILINCPLKDRNAVLREFQKFLTDRVRDFHNRQKLQVIYDQSLSSWQFVNSMLKAASETGKEGQVAQYLVGAKLELRYPDIVIENYSSSTADQQSAAVVISRLMIRFFMLLCLRCQRSMINVELTLMRVSECTYWYQIRNLPLAKGNAEMHLAGKIFCRVHRVICWSEC